MNARTGSRAGTSHTNSRGTLGDGNESRKSVSRKGSHLNQGDKNEGRYWARDNHGASRSVPNFPDWYNPGGTSYNTPREDFSALRDSLARRGPSRINLDNTRKSSSRVNLEDTGKETPPNGPLPKVGGTIPSVQQETEIAGGQCSNELASRPPPSDPSENPPANASETDGHELLTTPKREEGCGGPTEVVPGNNRSDLDQEKKQEGAEAAKNPKFTPERETSDPLGSTTATREHTNLTHSSHPTTTGSSLYRSTDRDPSSVSGFTGDVTRGSTRPPTPHQTEDPGEKEPIAAARSQTKEGTQFESRTFEPAQPDQRQVGRSKDRPQIAGESPPRDDRGAGGPAPAQKMTTAPAEIGHQPPVEPEKPWWSCCCW